MDIAYLESCRVEVSDAGAHEADPPQLGRQGGGQVVPTQWVADFQEILPRFSMYTIFKIIKFNS